MIRSISHGQPAGWVGVRHVAKGTLTCGEELGCSMGQAVVGYRWCGTP